LLKEERLLFSFRILRFRQHEAHRQDAIRIEARIDVAQTLKTFNQKPRADEQHERERNFRDDEQAAHTIAPPAFRRAAPALFERLVQVEPRSLQRGREAEDDACQKRDRQREAEHASVQRNLLRARHARRNQLQQHIHAPHRQQQA
jgi:hypothetical protein